MSSMFTSNVHVPNIETLSEPPDHPAAMQNLCEGKEVMYSPVIMFGANNQAADHCRSSDGSNFNNKDQVDHFAQLLMFSNGGGNINVGEETQAANELFSGDNQTDLPLNDNNLEEIKQLISTSNSNLNIFGDDEGKMTYIEEEKEKVIMYY